MPVDYGKYPKDWKAISKAIRERSGRPLRVRWRVRATPDDTRAATLRRASWRACEVGQGEGCPDRRAPDHTPEDCRPENLKAMCQRCHLRYDHDHHMKNASATRRKGKAERDSSEGACSLAAGSGSSGFPGQELTTLAALDRLGTAPLPALAWRRRS
jgi:hypothetical protein